MKLWRLQTMQNSRNDNDTHMLILSVFLLFSINSIVIDFNRLRWLGFPLFVVFALNKRCVWFALLPLILEYMKSWLISIHCIKITWIIVIFIPFYGYILNTVNRFSFSQFVSKHNSCSILDLLYLRVIMMRVPYLGIASFDNTIDSRYL